MSFVPFGNKIKLRLKLKIITSTSTDKSEVDYFQQDGVIHGF